MPSTEPTEARLAARAVAIRTRYSKKHRKEMLEMLGLIGSDGALIEAPAWASSTDPKRDAARISGGQVTTRRTVTSGGEPPPRKSTAPPGLRALRNSPERTAQLPPESSAS